MLQTISTAARVSAEQIVPFAEIKIFFIRMGHIRKLIAVGIYAILDSDMMKKM
jgi:hypothetical protein